MNLYYCNIHEFNTLDGIELLSQQRQDAIRAYRNDKDKVRCLLAGLMTRKGLGEHYYSQLTKGPYGKPLVADQSGPCFNVSHSGDYVIFAMSSTAIGVDIECISTYSPQVAKKCFCTDELQWLEATKAPESFYQLWCGKESIMKALGEGFHMDPCSYSIAPVRNGFYSIRKQPWYLYWQTINGHQVCVCSAQEEDSISLIPLTLADLLDSTPINSR